MITKNINRLLTSALTVIALTACTNETKENGLDNRISLTVKTSSIAASRATDNTWQAADAIGVTLFEGGTSTTVEGNPLAGKYVTPTGDGAFTAADKANTLYFPTQNKKVDIVAFYPYTTIDGSLTVPVDVTDQSKLSAIDLMVADKVSGKSATDNEVALTFRHQLVKLDFTIDKVDVSEEVDLSKAVVTIEGTPTKAVWNLMDETLAVDEADKATLTLPAAYHAADDALSGTAILVPTAIKDVTIYIKVGGYTFEVPFTDAMKLQAGTHNTLRIHLKQTRATVEAAVTDWTTGVTVDLNNLQIVVTDTPETPEGSEPTFTEFTIEVADAPIISNTGESGAPFGTQYNYEKQDDGSWTSTNPIYLDELTATSTLYGFVLPTDGDGRPNVDNVTGLPDLLGTDATTVQGGTAAFNFRHLYAQFTVKLVAGPDYISSLDGAGIATPTMIATAHIGTDADGNTLAVATDDTDTYAIASDATHIVIPQTLSANSVFTVTLTNGNTYTAALTEDVALEAGKNTTLTLTLMPTATAVKATVTDWGTAAASAEVKLAGLTDGSVNYTANVDDILSIYYNSTSRNPDVPYARATYIYGAEGWDNTAVLYWDVIDRVTYTGKFIAWLTPMNFTTPEVDYLTGIVTDVAYGGELNFNLHHSTAKLTFTIRGGTGITDIDAEVPTRTLTIGQSLMSGSVNDDGIMNYGDLIDSEVPITTDALYLAPQTLTDAHVVTLTRPNGNTYTVKLTDLQDDAGVTIFTDGKIEAGKHYAITLTVNETSVGISATIADWNVVNGSGEMKPDFQ